MTLTSRPAVRSSRRSPGTGRHWPALARRTRRTGPARGFGPGEKETHPAAQAGPVIDRTGGVPRTHTPPPGGVVNKKRGRPCARIPVRHLKTF